MPMLLDFVWIDFYYYESLRLTWTYLRPFMVIPMHWVPMFGYWIMNFGLWTLDLITPLITLVNFNNEDLSLRSH